MISDSGEIISYFDIDDEYCRIFIWFQNERNGFGNGWVLNSGGNMKR